MISAIPANVPIPAKGLENGAITNDDGHGFAIASAEHGLDTFKSMQFEQTLDALFEARNKHGQNSVVLFHSRFGTHGEMSLFNVHPFEVEDGTVMAHNGILPSNYHPEFKDRRSDTRIFVDRMAGYFCGNPNGVPSRRGSSRLGQIIGTGNKLAFLSVKSGQPKVRLVNSHLGKSEGGVWYSNDGYRWGGFSRRDYSWWGDGSVTDLTKRVSLPGIKEHFDGDCPMCGTWDVSLTDNVCNRCEFCLDCEDFLDSCGCYMPGKKYVEEPESDILGIEDSAENGYVKVNGVWRFASSLFDEPKREQRVVDGIALENDETIADRAAAIEQWIEEAKAKNTERKSTAPAKSKALVKA